MDKLYSRTATRIIFFGLFLLPSPLLAQKRLDSLFTSLHHNKLLNGNVLVADNGKVVYKKSFGYSDLQKRTKLNHHTVFNIASLTKPILATAILQLQVNKKIALDEPVQKHLPDFSYPIVTIRHLLTHTSGLPNSLFDLDSLLNAHPDKPLSNKDIIASLKIVNRPLYFKPGDQFQYNNLNYNLLALLIEKVTGVRVEEYLQDHIFEPAGMKATYLPAASITITRYKEDKRQASYYIYPNGYSLQVASIDSVPSGYPLIDRGNFRGAGEVISTTGDLFLFVKALSRGILLPEKERQEALTPYQLNDGQLINFPWDGQAGHYGLGWVILSHPTYGKVVGHPGSWPGHTSVLLSSLATNQTCIILDNTTSDVLATAAVNALQILNKLPLKKQRKSLSRLYGHLLVTTNADQAFTTINRLKQDTAHYYLKEEELNQLGYEFLGKARKQEALKTLEAKTKFFSASWNTFASYAEALLKNDQPAEAIRMYQKSVSLNPHNENALKILEALSKNQTK